MQTEKLEQQLWDYVEGNLSESEMERFDKFLKDNLELKKEHDVIRSIHDGLVLMPLQELDSAFTEKIVASVPKITTSSSRGDFYWLAACFTILIGTAMTLMTFWQSDFSALYQFDLWMVDSSIFRYLIVFIAIPFLFLLDDWLKKRYSRSI